jgi:hypothetical protein
MNTYNWTTALPVLTLIFIIFIGTQAKPSTQSEKWLNVNEETEKQLSCCVTVSKSFVKQDKLGHCEGQGDTSDITGYVYLFDHDSN